jgi:hypothetical protein
VLASQQPRVNDPPERQERRTTKARRTQRRTKEEKKENDQGGLTRKGCFVADFSAIPVPVHFFVLLGALRTFVVNLLNSSAGMGLRHGSRPEKPARVAEGDDLLDGVVALPFDRFE